MNLKQVFLLMLPCADLYAADYVTWRLPREDVHLVIAEPYHRRLADECDVILDDGTLYVSPKFARRVATMGPRPRELFAFVVERARAREMEALTASRAQRDHGALLGILGSFFSVAVPALTLGVEAFFQPVQEQDMESMRNVAIAITSGALAVTTLGIGTYLYGRSSARVCEAKALEEVFPPYDQQTLEDVLVQFNEVHPAGCCDMSLHGAVRTLLKNKIAESSIE